MKLFLQGIPERFGKSYLISGCFPVAYLMLLNGCIYLLKNKPENWKPLLHTVVSEIQNLKTILGLVFEPTLVIGFFILSLVAYNLRFISIRILSGNLPFIWYFGRNYQIHKNQKIRRKIFSYLTPFAWVAKSNMKWVATQEKARKQWTWHLLKFLRLTIWIMNKITLKPTLIRLPLWYMYKIMRATNENEHNYKEKKGIYDKFKANVDKLYYIETSKGYPDFVKTYNEQRKIREARYSSAYYDYPIDTTYIMPTLFGNILRRGEAHAKECYGIDHEIVWPHLVEVTSKEYSKVLSIARDNLDAASQLAVFTIFSLIVWIIILLFNFSFSVLLLILGLFAFSCMLYSGAVVSAREYVRYVIGCYDLFQNTLLRKLPKIKDIHNLNLKNQWEFLMGFLHEGRVSIKKR